MPAGKLERMTQQENISPWKQGSRTPASISGLHAFIAANKRDPSKKQRNIVDVGYRSFSRFNWLPLAVLATTSLA